MADHPEALREVATAEETPDLEEAMEDSPVDLAAVAVTVKEEDPEVDLGVSEIFFLD